VTGYGIIVWGPAVFMRTYGISAADTGLLLGAGQLCINSVAGFLGGFLSDVVLARRPADGRLWTLFLIFPPLLLFLALLGVQGSPAMTLLAAVGAGGVAASLNSINYNVLYDVVPTRYRGQIISTYLLFGTFLGLAVGPTAIAVITDHVFGDARMIQFSLLIVCICATGTSLACTALVLPRYRAIQRAIAAGEA
jgi:hypothetical protein